jgi:iron complex outermembrane receptor protein
MSLKSVFVFSLSIFSSFISFAQESTDNDSVKVLNEVVVQAFATDRPLNEVAAAVSFINQKNLERFNNTSLLPAVNTIPGVRMEERSPGSYRFSLRGSLLRSPFGVRNVKMYWNGLPLTDGGGNTYINLLDFNSVTSLEIIKGPGASLYGAGTGGVVLLNSNLPTQNQATLSLTGGDYGLKRYLVSATMGSEKVRARVQYARQESDGYRDHTAMRRDIANVDAAFIVNSKSTLSTTMFYSDLFYETPGGLNKVQYDANPRQARMGADDVKASVSNKTFYAGLSYDYQWNEHWSTILGVFGSTTEFVNPTFRNNYEQRSEDNLGGRIVSHYKFEKDNWKGKITFGGEHQQFKSPVHVTSNDGGIPGAQVISDDDLSSTQTLLFVQAEFDLPLDFILTAGLGSTFLKYNLVRFQPDASTVERNFDPVISPRIALLKKFGSDVSVYGTVSSGFSPPSLAEVRPSTNEFNNSLNPEHGVNYEAGIKGHPGSFSYELSLFRFDLKETIVIQRTPDGADYFINAGSTRQQGMELQLRWSPKFNTNNLGLSIFGSYTLNYFHFDNYINDGNDFSGNRLTGVAPNVLVIGADIVVRSRLYFNATMNYTDHIPLNDANSEFAQEYYLFGLRAGYKALASTKFPLEFFAGVDNAFDRKYSLGNDLNAQPNAAPRFYNVAAGRNFYVGLKANGLFGKMK